MNERGPAIHPYWRAVIGAAFGFGIGSVAMLVPHHFWAAIFLIVMVIVGGAVGVLAISGE